jgi:hypothetical protein
MTTQAEYTSPDGQIERIRSTVNSMQRRIRALDVLIEEQIRTLDLERDLFRPAGIVITARYWRLLQAAAVAAAILAFASGFVAGYQGLGR